jgi:LPS O-antigen subunit length determinant protein (WzzB/FepE family)
MKKLKRRTKSRIAWASFWVIALLVIVGAMVALAPRGRQLEQWEENSHKADLIVIEGCRR